MADDRSSNTLTFEEFSPELGDDNFIARGARIIGNVTTESGVSFWYNTVVRGDVCPIQIGEDTNVQDLTMIHVTTGTHPTTIGARVTIGHRAIIHGCTIEDETLIGMGAILLDGVHVGKHCLIGAGALISPGTKIPDRSLVLGMPGKVIRQTTDQEIEGFLRSAAGYRALAERHVASGNF